MIRRLESSETTYSARGPPFAMARTKRQLMSNSILAVVGFTHSCVLLLRPTYRSCLARERGYRPPFCRKALFPSLKVRPHIPSPFRARRLWLPSLSQTCRREILARARASPSFSLEKPGMNMKPTNASCMPCKPPKLTVPWFVSVLLQTQLWRRTAPCC